jgi:hypothetical protein
MYRSKPNPIVIFAWLVGVIAVLFTIGWDDLSTKRNVTGLLLCFLAYVTMANYVRGMFSWHFTRAIYVCLFSSMAMLYYWSNHRVATMISTLFVGVVVVILVSIATYLRIKYPTKLLAKEHIEIHPGWISVDLFSDDLLSLKWIRAPFRRISIAVQAAWLKLLKATKRPQ